MILGAVGTGKTSACMYPYVDQLLRWQADDPARKIGGLVLEVKGDFCGQVRSHARSATGRDADYVEIGLDTGVCYNPLHNDLDPYAVAYAIATLLNNLFGKSKEPFWQQAYTDLLKFVILLRRITDGYTTFSEVYRYILDDPQIDRDIRRLKADLAEPPDVLRHPAGRLSVSTASQTPWAHWFAEDAGPHGAPVRRRASRRSWTRARCRTTCGSRRAPGGPHGSTSSRPSSAGTCTAGVGSTRRLRSSIVEGIVVFLSLFDDNPAVHRAFCPPRSAYTEDPPAGRTAAARRRSTRCSRAGTVLALNFPVGHEPWPGADPGRDAEAGFPARGAAAHPADHGATRHAPGATCCSSATSTTPSPPSAKTDPTGDERTFALSRQARLIPIVATQSISSLRSALPGDESWRTLLQCFRTKVFLATSDEFTAQERRGAVRPARSTEGALQPVRVRAGRAHLAADRPADVRDAVAEREQELRAAPRVHLRAARVHGAAERAGHRAAVRRHQPAAAAVLLPEAALPGRADQLLRSPGAGRAMSSLDRILPFLRPIEDLLRRPGHHRGDGERRRAARVRRARGVHRSACRTGRWKSGI